MFLLLGKMHLYNLYKNVLKEQVKFNPHGLVRNHHHFPSNLRVKPLQKKKKVLEAMVEGDFDAKCSLTKMMYICATRRGVLKCCGKVDIELVDVVEIFSIKEILESSNASHLRNCARDG
jgi:hypothetical protein